MRLQRTSAPVATASTRSIDGFGRRVPKVFTGSLPVRWRMVAVATAYSTFTVVADLLPRPGVLTQPGGGFGVQVLWLALALVAASRPLTARFAWLVVLSAAVDVIPALGYLESDIAAVIAGAWNGLGPVVFAHLVIGFPTGALLTRFDRRVMTVLYAYALAFGPLFIAIWDPASRCDPGGFCPRNPFVIWPNNGLLDAVLQGTAWLVPLFSALVVVSVARHWRAATPAGRRVLLPVILAIPFSYLSVSVAYLAPVLEAQWLAQLLSDPLVELHTWIWPGAFLIGVLRAQLARGAVGDLAVRLSGGAGSRTLREVLSTALGDPTLEVAYSAASGTGFVDAAGTAVDLPASTADRSVYRIDGADGMRAVLVYDSAIDLEDPGRVDRVAAVALLAIENERLTAQVRAQLDEVQQSRARIVQAADDERRRVERDLHDGAQQRLVALAMRLQLARETMSSVPALVDSTAAELQAAIAEVRDLARGLYPTILTEAGLGAALEALAEQSAVPVRVSTPDRRFPRAIEAAVYFVVAEALTNVARYAAATDAAVDVTEESDTLMVIISDDGRGGADIAAGSGLRGLKDRVAALGGTLDVTSPAGGGTTLVASIPLA